MYEDDMDHQQCLPESTVLWDLAVKEAVREALLELASLLLCPPRKIILLWDLGTPASRSVSELV